MAEIGSDIEIAARLLEQEEVVAIPTETVYGLAGNALSARAVAQIYTVKNRPSFNPLIIHSSALERLLPYLEDVPPVAHQLTQKFWPGPLTLLLEKTERVPDVITAGSARVAVRVPRHPLAQQLLSRLDFPLAAPSANPSGYVSPTTAAHVAEQLGNMIPYILDGGPCVVGLESTIVGFENGRVVVYRWGGVTQEALQQCVGSATPVVFHATGAETPAPGMLASHYAPRQPVVVGDLADLIKHYSTKRVGLLTFRDTYPPVAAQHQVALSPSGDLAEAAQRVFAALRYLEKLPVTHILAETVPDKGIGRAINDRLRRAAAH
ncbi:MAG: L-threonylcarbamoyladenylate synthase [Tunicatimonas sp.]